MKRKTIYGQCADCGTTGHTTGSNTCGGPREDQQDRLDNPNDPPCATCGNAVSVFGCYTACGAPDSNDDPICVDCGRPIGDAESMVRNNGGLSHLGECPKEESGQ